MGELIANPNCEQCPYLSWLGDEIARGEVQKDSTINRSAEAMQVAEEDAGRRGAHDEFIRFAEQTTPEISEQPDIKWIGRKVSQSRARFDQSMETLREAAEVHFDAIEDFERGAREKAARIQESCGGPKSALRHMLFGRAVIICGSADRTTGWAFHEKPRN